MDEPEPAVVSQFAPFADFLLSLLSGISIPESHLESADVEYPARDGWKVTIFYDCGELDYIDHFTRPDGSKIDFWDWPEESPDKARLINWRGN